MNAPAKVYRLATGSLNGERGEAISRLNRFLLALPQDKAYTVTVADYKPRRSGAQNAYLWGVVYPAILQGGGESLRGWTAADLHEYLLGEVYGWEDHSGFGRRRIRPVRRSSALNKQEFSDFIEAVRAKMAEHGITIPEAE